MIFIKHHIYRSPALLLWALLLIALPTGCKDKPIPDGMPYDAINPSTNIFGFCSTCHGNSDNAAPPLSTAGEYSPTDIAVGAHQSHMRDGIILKGLPCQSCHVVPLTVDDAGHINGSADITFSALASNTGLNPVWNRENRTCSATYCHGASLSGGTNKTPEWTAVSNTQAVCGSCHGAPPPAPHTEVDVCSMCHFLTVKANGEIDLEGRYHIDGTVQSENASHPPNFDLPEEHGYTFYENPVTCRICHGEDLDGGVSGLSCDACHTNETSAWRTQCTFCHGGADNQTGAPPLGVKGETEISSSAVGAHTAHLQESSSHAAWECSTCHTVPSAFNDMGHIDGTTGAEMIFSSIGGASAGFDRSNSFCSG